LEACCRCSDVEVWSSGGAPKAEGRRAMELWRYAVGEEVWKRTSGVRCGSIEARSSRGWLQACRREVWISGAREACCRPGDVEARGGAEVCVEALQARRRVGVEAWSSGGVLQV